MLGQGGDKMVDSASETWHLALCLPIRAPHKRRNPGDVLLTNHASPYLSQLVSALDQCQIGISF